MALNLNFGEHYYEAGNLSVFYDVSITFLGAFLGLLAAFCVNRFLEQKQLAKEKEQEKKNSLSHLKYFSLLLSSVLETYPKQAENYIKLSKSIHENTLKLNKPNIQATFDLVRLKNTDNIDLREAYKNYFPSEQQNIINYKQIFSEIDFLLRYFKQLEVQNKDHINFQHKDKSFVRDCIEDITNHFEVRLNRLKLNNPVNFRVDKEYMYLQNYCSKLNTIGKGELDFQKVKDEFLIPIYKTISSGIVNAQLSETVLILVKKAVGRLRHIQFNSIQFADDLKDVCERIKNPISNLKKTNGQIENLLTSQKKH